MPHSAEQASLPSRSRGLKLDRPAAHWYTSLPAALSPLLQSCELGVCLAGVGGVMYRPRARQGSGGMRRRRVCLHTMPALGVPADCEAPWGWVLEPSCGGGFILGEVCVKLITIGGLLKIPMAAPSTKEPRAYLSLSSILLPGMCSV